MIIVWGTYRNSDMTEGKGSMVLDKIFTEERDAHEYINGQEGVFGRKPDPGVGWQNSRMGDWQVKPIQVMEHLHDTREHAQRLALQRAMEKLTREEREALEFHMRQALMASEV